MPDCIFCKIAEGKIPSEKILGDETAYAFMDIRPLAEGHVLLIPRQHYKTLDELDAATSGKLLSHLPALVRAVQSVTGCQGVNILQNNGRVAHQEILHVHFHIIPRNPGDAFQFNWPAGEYPQNRMQQLATAIRDTLQTE